MTEKLPEMWIIFRLKQTTVSNVYYVCVSQSLSTHRNFVAAFESMEFPNLYPSQNVIRVIKSRTPGWAGNVSYTEKDLICTTV